MNVQKVTETFKQLNNPFDMNSAFNHALFSVSSGQPASDPVSSSLLQYIDTGYKAAENFINTRLVT